MQRLLSFFEPFILMLLATVLIATLLPAQGGWRGGLEVLADVAIVILFFLHGAKLSRQAIIDGAKHWRLGVSVGMGAGAPSA